MSDDAGAHVGAHRESGWSSFQEFMIRRARRRARCEGFEFRGAEQASAERSRCSRRSRGARAIIIGPSNPLVSIGPILAVPGMREALAAARAPVVAVSPIVGGEVLKGPTASLHGLRRRSSATPAGVAALLRRAARRDRRRRRRVRAALPTLQTDTRMDDAAARACRQRSTSPRLATLRASPTTLGRAIVCATCAPPRSSPSSASPPPSSASARASPTSCALRARARDGRRRARSRWRRRDAIERTIVVTSEQSVAAAPRAAGARSWSKTTPRTASRRRSRSASRARWREGIERALCVPGDCPALDPRRARRAAARGRARSAARS